jgi:hypothetical protein
MQSIEGDIEKEDPCPDDEETQAKGYIERGDTEIQDTGSSSIVKEVILFSNEY